MAEGLFDFFSRARGQERRAALEGLLTQFIPPELRPQLGLLAEANPVVSMERAGQDAQTVFAPDVALMDRLAAGGRMASNMAGVVAPAVVAGRAGMPVANAVQESLMGLSASPQMAAVRDYLVDDFGGVSVPGFRAFHGSPHDFDKFSMSKIGTGEGAQAYGHGLYFAENEGVARGYRDALSARAAPNDARGNAFDLVQRMGGDVDATAELLRESIPTTTSPNTEQFLRETLKHIEDGTYADFERPLGRMYEVNINANPEDFLDWDKPLSEQHARVRESLGTRVEALRQAGAGLPQDPIGEALWRVAHPQGGFDKTDFSRSVPEQATERLRDAGIPGIRYLDAGSRSFTPTTIKDTPSGSELYWGNDPVPVDVFPTRQAAEEAAKQFDTRSRNYVVFDENLIEIVRKYGIAGAATLLGISQADVVQAMQQQQQPQTSGLLE